jgi:peptide/nickel transport system ATP-binding protein/oligopeptide transport system ATP-binding protein
MNRVQQQALIEIRGARKTFAQRGDGLGAARSFVAVDDVSFDIGAGETVGCVGETGSGKSTLGRMILNLIPLDGGEIRFDGRRIDVLGAREMRPLRRDMQIVFQDSLQAMNGRRTVAENLVQPLLNFGMSNVEAYARLANTLSLVGLDIAHAGRYPHEFSGGQCQRMGIARAMMGQPRFIFLDEPVSALDVSIQAQIVNLLLDLKQRFGLTYLFVSHDIGIVRYVSDRIVVLYHGRVVEIGGSDDLYAAPLHPYSLTLRAAALSEENRDSWIQVARQAGALADGAGRPDEVARGAGCIYVNACPSRQPRCTEQVPALREVAPERFVACHLVGEG